MKDIHDDEVVFERIDEDPMLIAIASATLRQANVLNISILNEKLTMSELEKRKLQDEIINLKTNMKKSTKVNDHLSSLKKSILIEKELLHMLKLNALQKFRRWKIY